MVDRLRLVPASYVFLLRDGANGDEVLLQLRQNTGYMDAHWAAAAAGHVESGETAYDAARREAAEEIGVGLGDLDFLTSMQRTGHADPIDERVDFFFGCRSWAGRPRIVEPQKCAALEWFPLDALPDPVVPHELTVLTRLGVGLPAYTTYGFGMTDVGEQPTPEIEPAEPPPGGVDAVGSVEYDVDPLVPDLAAVGNTASRDEIPDEVTEPDETDDGPSTDGASEPEKVAGMSERPEGTENEQPTELQDSSPNAGGPERAAGGMGVSSERVGHSGGSERGTDGERDTSAPAHQDDAGDLVGSDAEFEQGDEENPTGIEPRAGYPSLDPRSEDLPSKDA